MLPLVKTPTSFGPKSSFLVNYTTNRNCEPNLTSLASMAAKINSGSLIFGWSLCQTPANVGPKSCCLVSYSPNSNCIPNLKLLASVAAEINRESHFFDAPLTQTPVNFVLKVTIGKLLTNPKSYTKLDVASFNGCRNK